MKTSASSTLWMQLAKPLSALPWRRCVSFSYVLPRFKSAT